MTFLFSNRNILLICIAIFLSMIGFGMIFPLLPTMAASFDASKTEIGIVATLFALTRTLLVRPFGALSDRIGRKPMLMWGFVGYGIFMSLFAFATNIYWMYILRAAQGISSASVWPAASAYIADSVDASERGKAMGYMGMATSVGIMFGPAIGGFLKDLYGIQLPFIICGILTGSMAIFIKIMLKETVSCEYDENEPQDLALLHRTVGWIAQDYREIRGNVYARTLFGVMVAGFIFNFAYALIEPLLPIFAEESLNASATQVGLAFTLAGTVGVIVRPIAGSLADSIGRKKPIIVGSLYSGLMMLPMTVITTPAQMIYVLGARAAGWALVDPATLALLTDTCTERNRGKIFGLYQLSTGMGWMMGPLVGGILYDLRGAELSFLLTAIGTLVATGILSITIQDTMKRCNDVQGSDI
jgi:DHA1 family multidrug resistance protein-like MFS transporter